ncbi:DUF3072 domain-containing protein [Bradyrhizobium sp. 26S5]|uniref:DUF3072 domain-containing protein n=1 Tax=Bradyrhizobium sp. 26S5 TaxID=3139729 RepID=UPI0030D625A1
MKRADNTQKDPKSWVSGDDPMTSAQESYLKTLPSRRISRSLARPIRLKIPRKSTS